jgi:hypothetical protein
LLHYFVRKINGVKIIDILKNTLPFLIAVCIAIFFAYVISTWFSNVYIKPLTKIIVTAIVYFGILKIAKSEILAQSVGFLKSFLKRK